MLAMPFARPARSSTTSTCRTASQFDQHTISDGPYQITSYVPSRSITLARNPAWKQSTDPIRHQYVNEITVTMGVTDAADPARRHEGRHSTTCRWTPRSSRAPYPTLMASHDPKFNIWPWISTVPYIVFNLQSPNASGAMKKLAGPPGDRVRRSTRSAVQKVFGGPTVAKIINTVDPAGQRRLRELQPVPANGGNGRRGQVQVTAGHGRLQERRHAQLRCTRTTASTRRSSRPSRRA